MLLCALVDPGAERGDLVFGEGGEILAHVDGRHFHIEHEIGGEVDDGALGAFAGDDGGFAAIAAFDEGFAGGDRVAAFGAVAAMALEAGGFDDLFDMLVEGDPGFGGGRR